MSFGSLSHSIAFCCTGFHRRCSLSKSIAIRRSEISAPYITHFIASAGFAVCGFWIIFGKWTPVKSQSWSDPFEKPGDISNLISCVRVSESFFFFWLWLVHFTHAMAHGQDMECFGIAASRGEKRLVYAENKPWHTVIVLQTDYESQMYINTDIAKQYARSALSSIVIMLMLVARAGFFDTEHGEKAIATWCSELFFGWMETAWKCVHAAFCCTFYRKEAIIWYYWPFGILQLHRATREWTRIKFIKIKMCTHGASEPANERISERTTRTYVSLDAADRKRLYL